MTDYLDLVDVHTDGTRYDVSPLFADPTAAAALTADLVAPFVDLGVTHVAGLDALGFVLGALAARELGVGFVPLRKAGKLPVPTYSRHVVDYSGTQKGLELRRDAVGPGDRVLILDDWVETGAQMAAATELLGEAGATVVGFAAICIDRTEKTCALREIFMHHDVWCHDP